MGKVLIIAGLFDSDLLLFRAGISNEVFKPLLERNCHKVLCHVRAIGKLREEIVLGGGALSPCSVAFVNVAAFGDARQTVVRRATSGDQSGTRRKTAAAVAVLRLSIICHIFTSGRGYNILLCDKQQQKSRKEPSMHFPNPSGFLRQISLSRPLSIFDVSTQSKCHSRIPYHIFMYLMFHLIRSHGK